MAKLDETRRRFMAHFASVGLGSTLAPGIIWARLQDAQTQRVTVAMVTEALKLSGIEASEADRQALAQSANQNLTRFEEVRKIPIPNDVSPPFHFSALAPGIQVNKTKLPFRLSAAPAVKRPSNLEDVAFWPVRHLAELIRTRQVTSVEMTEMYLTRLHRYNGKLNNVVTFLDDVARAQAKQADADIAAGKYKGPLHGIPWGAKDIISVKGYKTTWGSAPLKDQVFDYDASVVEMLRDAGAVLLAKLSTGELAAGDQWFGGRTNSPWDPSQGSSGSSAGPSSATAAGCVGFGIGTETSGSILSPSARCGLAGLRPTFGRISRYGVMALSWTQDRLGPICRYAEDCAIVMQVIAKPDGRDMSVSDIPFNWNAQLDIRKLRVGYIKESFDDLPAGVVKDNAEKLLETLRTLGVTKFIPMTIPVSQTNVSGLGVESAVFFDHMARAGKMAGSRRGTRPTAWLVPAVEYLQGQRLRMMMMTELAAATAGVDVYIVASNAGGGGGGRGRGGDPADPSADPTTAAAAAGAGAAGAAGAAGGRGERGAGGGGGRGRGTGEPARPPGPAQRHSTMANLACYPAINVPNGFTAAGTPTNVTFFARPFGEMELLALAKAYQDAAGHHLKKPTKLDA
ncbi:MAG TPA: amidase [Vicinamibacterales bacterium]|jgi:Asp-tRNA(Asn)/Glu-tRNA(Gln) amidotransferase A subunit family amidase